MKLRQKVRTLKRYSKEFKLSRVQEYESGEFSALELCRLYGFAEVTMHRWIKKYSKLSQTNIVIVEDKQSATKKLAEYETRIEELERIVGQKQITIDYLERMIELAKEHYGMDIKKNSDTPHLDGSDKTGKK